MKLLSQSLALLALQDELKRTPRNNTLKRHDLGSKISQKSKTCDDEAEVLREWLEDANNISSFWYISASRLYLSYKDARLAYLEWKNNPTTANLSRMRIMENAFAETVRQVDAFKKKHKPVAA